MSDLMTQARWLLVAAFSMSLLYELYRAIAKRGTSKHDSMEHFVKDNVAFYAIAGIVIGLLFTGARWAAWVGLVFCAGVIVASIVYYNAKIIIERVPGFIDWFEDVTFTGLVFVAGALLLYQVLDRTLQP